MMFTSPQPNGGFRWVQLEGGPALVCEALESFAQHFFTTRTWRLGDRTASAGKGWDEIAVAAGVAPPQLRRVHQVHGFDVAIYRKGSVAPADAPKADIVLTDDNALAVAVQTADCLPLLLVDPTAGVVAAAHAGWRGLAASAPRVAVDRIVSDFNGRRGDLMVAIGPAIGACCYEVGEDVRSRFEREGFAPVDIARWFRAAPAILPANPPMPSLRGDRRPNHWFFDGWSCARGQLVSAGVPADQIFSAALCTASHEQCFCSYRRDGAVAGRMAAVIRPGPSPR